MKKIIFGEGDQKYQMSVSEIIIYIICFIVLTLLTIFWIYYAINANRLYQSGKCVVVLTTSNSLSSKGGRSNDVSYEIDGVHYNSSVPTRSRIIAKGERYWAIYLPSDPEIIIRLLLDPTRSIIPAKDSINLPPVCNCNDRIKMKKVDYDFIL